MANDRPDTEGFGEDVIRTPEEVARDERKQEATDTDDAATKEKKERARQEFNLNEADHRRNPHG